MYILKNDKNDYITPTKRKYFKIALKYVIDNKINSCKVNNICFIFNFEKLQVLIKSNKDDRFYKHDMIQKNKDIKHDKITLDKK